MPRTGKFLGMPYDFRRPTRERLRSRLWNKDDRIFTPKAFGWGWDINLRGRGLRSRPRPEDSAGDDPDSS
jgi:Family of unknown function (DUF5808)